MTSALDKLQMQNSLLKQMTSDLDKLQMQNSLLQQENTLLLTVLQNSRSTLKLVHDVGVLTKATTNLVEFTIGEIDSTIQINRKHEKENDETFS